MKTIILTILVFALGLIICQVKVSEADEMGTAFTYQGRLIDGNDVADGLYDFEFKLYMELPAVPPIQVGDTVNMDDVDVIGGYFTVEIDFGEGLPAIPVFDGKERLLEIAVRPGDQNDPNVYTPLSPWQVVTPTPYAMHSKNAETFDGLETSDFAYYFHNHSGSDITSGTVAEVYIDSLIARDSEIMSWVLAADGSGSTLDADLLDGQDASAFAAVSHSHDGVYALISHNHDGIYALISHSHDGVYSPIGHDHDLRYYTESESNSNFVNVTGDTMAGTLTLPSDGLVVGTDQLAISGGNVGVGTDSPSEKLEVDGNAKVTGDLTVEGAITGLTNSTQKLVHDFVVESSENISAGDVVEFLDNGKVRKRTVVSPDSVRGYDIGTQIPAPVVVLTETKIAMAFGTDEPFADDRGKANIADVNGSTITFGSKYVFQEGKLYYPSAVALSDTKFVVVYTDPCNSRYGTAVVGDVSGNEITFGPEYVFNTSTTNEISAAALTETKIVVVYDDADNFFKGTAMVLTISGNSISLGSEYVFNSGSIPFSHVVHLSDTKFVVAYADDGNSYYGTAIIGNVSGSTITFGSEYVFNSTNTCFISADAFSNNKFVIAYSDDCLNFYYYGTAIVGEVTGSTIAFGDPVVFNNADSRGAYPATLTETKFVIAYSDFDNSQYGTLTIGDVSGNSITFNSEHVFNNSITGGISIAPLTETKFIVAYKEPSGDVVMCYVPGFPMGTADIASSAGESVSVIIHGVSDNHNGLTINQLYYGTDDGDLTEDSGGGIRPRIGLAISSTELLLDIKRE